MRLTAIIADGSRVGLLEGLACPTLVLHGDADPLLPAACGLDIAAAVPKAQAVVVPGMGHNVPHAIAAVLADEIATFANSVGAPTPARDVSARSSR